MRARLGRMLVVAVLLACRGGTEPGPRALRGAWVLTRYDGRPLPAIYRASDVDSLILLADTLRFGDAAAVSRRSSFRGWTPQRSYAFVGGIDGTFTSLGGQIEIHVPCGDCGPTGSSAGTGQLQNGAITFVGGGEPTRVYVYVGAR